MDWKNIRVIAVVGASANRERDSNEVFRYFIEKGYEVIPVNPRYEDVEGKKCYPSLLEIPKEIAKRIDMVDIFRRAEFVPPIVEESIKLKEKYGNLKVIWMQYGAYNADAEKMAKEHGLEVISNACAMVTHKSEKAEFKL